MKKNVLEYKGYHTKIEFISETKTLFGKIEGINDLVTFEAAEVKDVEKEFHSAVDDYLAFCEEIGQAPDKEYKGSFNIRIDPSLHRAIALKADKEGVSLNAAVEQAIQQFIHPSDSSTTVTVISSSAELGVFDYGYSGRPANTIPKMDISYLS